MRKLSFIFIKLGVVVCGKKAKPKI